MVGLLAVAIIGALMGWMPEFEWLVAEKWFALVDVMAGWMGKRNK